MNIYLKNLYFLFISFSSYVIDYLNQKKYFKKLTPIQNLITEYSRLLSKRDLYRIRDYSVRLFALIRTSSSLVKGYKMSGDERLSLTFLGAFSPIYDDFTDKTTLPYPEFKKLITHLNSYKPATVLEEFGIKLFNLGMDSLPDEKRNKKYLVLLKTHFIQYLSKNQKNANISEEETEYLTRAKGGYSTLLSRYILNVPVKKEEYQAWYNFGALIQLVDDIFDIKHDLKNGIFTLPGKFLSVTGSGKKLREYFNTSLLSIQRLPYPKRNKNKLAYRAFMFYLAGLIIIYQLKTFENKLGKAFNFTDIPNDQFKIKWWKIRNLLLFLRVVLTSKIERN